MAIPTFAEFQQGKTTTKSSGTSKVPSFSEFNKSLPVPKKTLGDKVVGVGKELVKGIVKPVATMVARPIQLGAELLGVSDQAVNQFTKDKFGDWVAPTPQNSSDVVKDLGRAGQTVLLGAGGSALKGAKLGTTIAKEAVIGAGFGGSAALEQKGSQITAKDFLKQTAIGGTIGAVAPLAIKGVGKLLSKKAPEIEKSVMQIVDTKTGNVEFKTIPKGKLQEFHNVIDDTQQGIAGKEIDGKVYHLTAKTPKSMESAGAVNKGMATIDEVPKSEGYTPNFEMKGDPYFNGNPQSETPGFKNISYAERTNILNQQTQQHIEDVVFNGATPEGGLPKESYIAHLYNQADNNPALAERLATSGVVTEAESQAGQNLGALAQAVKGTTVGIIRDAHQALKKALPGYVQKGEKKAVTEIQSKIKGVIDTFTDKSLTIEERLSALDILKCK